MEQISTAIKSHSHFINELCVSLGDTAYNTPHCLCNETIKPPTVVQKDFERIIRMIGTPAQPPKPRKSTPGRQVGDTQVKRTRHSVVKKGTNTAYSEKMIA